MTAVDLPLLAQQLAAGGIVLPYGLGTLNNTLETVTTYTATGEPTPLPPAAAPILAAHVAPPAVVDYAVLADVREMIRTTDATVVELTRFPLAAAHVYRANLRISAVDPSSFATRSVERRHVWKRPTTTAVIVGTDTLSDVRDTATVGWASSTTASGATIVYSVQGAAGVTIDWLLVGEIASFAPGGLG
jgi:hypothetical protein